MTERTPSTGFRPGTGTAIVGRSSSVLIAAARPSLVDELWPLVDAGADADVLLEALSAEGLRTTGAFAFARVEHGGVRVVVRGDAVAEVATPSGERRFEAHGIRTWAEHFVDEATAFTLTIGDQVATTGGHHLDRGVVPAEVIVWPHEPSAERGGPDSAADTEPPTDTEAPTATELPTEIELPTVTEPPTVGVPTVESDRPSSGSPDGETVHISQFADDEPGTHDEPGTGTAAGAVEDASPLAPPVAEPVEPAEPAEPAESADSSDYDSLYGHTVHRSVQQAAVDVAPDPEAGPADAPASGTATGPTGGAPFADPSIPAPVPLSGPPPTPPAAPSSTGLIARVPISGVPESGQPESGVGQVDGDHDGLTISAAQLRAMRGAAPPPAAPAPSMGGPTVQAVLCRSGHPNPPQRSVCRLCSEPLDGVPQIIPRPSMGRIVLSTGTYVELHRPAVIGRNPKIEGRLTGELPQTVKLDVGQALSRSHTMIRLEGWQVLAEDLGSANGTFVTLPGRPPQRLHPGEPVLLEPGSTIDLGGEVTGTYDATG